MATLPPGSSPFIGGAKINSGAPGSVGGNGFPGANTNVGAPAGGVNPGAPFTARNNSGSNIGALPTHTKTPAIAKQTHDQHP